MGKSETRQMLSQKGPNKTPLGSGGCGFPGGGFLSGPVKSGSGILPPSQALLLAQPPGRNGK